MGVKILLGVIVSLILIGFVAFFFWGGDEILEEVDVSVGVNDSVIAESDVVAEKIDATSDNSSVEVPEVVFQEIVLSLNFSSELIKLAREGRVLNLDEDIVNVFGRRAFGEDFPSFLKNVSDDGYEYEIKFSDNLVLREFEDGGYMDGNESVGFNFSSGNLVLDYIISFDDEILWEDFVGEEINIFGIPCEVVFSDYELKQIDLFELPYSFNLAEDEVVSVNSSFYDEVNFSIYFIDENRVILLLDGERIEVLNVGDFYYGDNFSFFVEDIFYSPKARKSSVDIIISPRKIVLVDGDLSYGLGDVDGIEISIDDDEYLDQIEFSWYLEAETFLTTDANYTNITVPFFESLVLSMEGYFRDDDYEKYWNIYLEASSFDVLSE